MGGPLELSRETLSAAANFWQRTRDRDYACPVVGSEPLVPGMEQTLKKIEGSGLGFNPGESYLDLGCLHGAMCIYAKTNGAGRIYGVDCDPARILEARSLSQLLGLDITFVNMCLQDYLLTANSFDVISAFAVLHYVKNHENIMRLIGERVSSRFYAEVVVADLDSLIPDFGPVLFRPTLMVPNRAFYKEWLGRSFNKYEILSAPGTDRRLYLLGCKG